MFKGIKKLFKVVANFKDFMDHPEFFEIIARIEDETTIDIKIKRKSETQTKEA